MEFHTNNEHGFKNTYFTNDKKKEKLIKQKVRDGTFPNKHIYELLSPTQ